MIKQITTTELKGQVGEIVNQVRLRGDTFVISQRGKAVAAVVPLKVLDDFNRSRDRLDAAIDGLRAAFAEMPAEELDAEIAKTIAEARRDKNTRNAAIVAEESAKHD